MGRISKTTIITWLILPLTGLALGNVHAADEEAPAREVVTTKEVAPTKEVAATVAAAATATAAAADATASLDDVMKMLKAQQAQLDTQKEQLAKQQGLINSFQGQQATIAEQAKQIEEQEKQLANQRDAMQSMQSQIDQVVAIDPSKLSAEQVAMREQLNSISKSVEASENAASVMYDVDSFPGSFPIPGSSAALRIGGYVKMNIVESFDPIGSADRFIVGTIPVPQQSTKAQAALTVDQSRLNFDLRDKTSFGPLRAFIEGDFAGTGTTFRLRHAFGQYRALMVGQNWSTFMDAEASPEELDFEGINGRLNVRQPQIRFFPEFAQDYNLLFALENPNAEIQNGAGLSQWPDFVVSIRRTWFDIFHVKTALLVRNLEATWADSPDPNNPVEDSVRGWGLTLSGRTALPWWDKRDNFLFQFNTGSGYGRYINDLNTICDVDDTSADRECFDGIFDDTGELRAIEVLSFYVAVQKWWNDTLRSNFNYSFVDVNNFEFQEDSAYNQTRRTSGNIVWSPTPRVDLGAELLYGNRENKNGDKASATQIQISAKYRY
jgi:hypothetical protein